MDNNKRYNFGLVIDELHDKVAKTIRNRVNSMRQQIVQASYQHLDTLAQGS